MNLGLGNLQTLKAFILAPALRDGTDYDDKIAALGKGVTGLLEKYCDRKFQRLESAVYETTADRLIIIVDRYPIETLTKIEIRDDLSLGWIDQGAINDVLFNLRNEAGLLQFAGQLGASFSRIRITYTGGYFFETLEPTDTGYPSAQPDGATALPDDLRFAWLLQCQHLWLQSDALNTAIVDKRPATPPLMDAKLVPSVEDILRDYRRLAIL